MPSQFSRFGEKLRQQLKLNSGNQGSGKDWRPTSNARSLAMIEESREFAKHVKLLLMELSDTNGGLVTRVEGSLSTMRTVLTASLPRAFDETGAGVAPLDSGDQIGGVAVDHRALARAGQDMQQRLTDEVILPLQQWLAAYRGIKARNKQVEEVRLDLDTKRREMLLLEERFAKLQGQSSKEAEDLQYKARSKEFKVGLLASRYRELEEEVFNALLNLISDTAMLREYQATALAIVQRCFTSAHKAFNTDTTIPEAVRMPVHPSAVDLLGDEIPPEEWMQRLVHSSMSNPQSTSKQSDSLFESNERERARERERESEGGGGVWVSNREESMCKDKNAQPDLESQSDSEPISECESESYPADAIHSFNEKFEDLALSRKFEVETLSSAGVASRSSAADRPAARKWFTETPASAKHADNVEQQSNSPPPGSLGSHTNSSPPWLPLAPTQTAAANPALHDTLFLSSAAAQSLQQQLSQPPSPTAPTPGPSQASNPGPCASSGSLPNASGTLPCAPCPPYARRVGSFPIPVGKSPPCSDGSFSSASGSFSSAQGTPPEAPSSLSRTPGCPPHAPDPLLNAPGTSLPDASGNLPGASGNLQPNASGCSPIASGTSLPKASGPSHCASGSTSDFSPTTLGSTPCASGAGSSLHASGTLQPNASGNLPKASSHSHRASGSTSDFSPTTLGSTPRASGAGSSLHTSGCLHASLASGPLSNASGSSHATSGDPAQGTAPVTLYPSVPNKSYAAARPPAPSWFTEAKANIKHPRQDKGAGESWAKHTAKHSDKLLFPGESWPQKRE